MSAHFFYCYKMAAPVPRIFWLHFNTMGCSGWSLELFWLILTFWSFVYLLIPVPKYHLLFLTTVIYSITHSCHSVASLFTSFFSLYLPHSITYSVIHTAIRQHLLSVAALQIHRDWADVQSAGKLNLSVRTHAHAYFSVTVVNRCDFHSLVRWQIQAADEGRAACSSTTLVITSQGTERMDHRSATACYR